tara:strand:+ start:7111 stop:7509 length:399 start_codon:yes stop_codon:yes gene_type:complete
MAERRSLSTALSTTIPGVDDELVRSFVTQNQRSERPVGETSKPVDSRRTLKIESAPAPEVASEKASRPKLKKGNRFQPVGLIPVTVRLRPEIAGALKRASLERELAGEEIFTQQAIVEEALEPWLSGEGFLD